MRDGLCRVGGTADADLVDRRGPPTFPTPRRALADVWLFDQGLADAMEPGSVIVVHTTGSPRTVEAIDARVRSGRVDVVDAPGSGGPARVADGTLTPLLGGADAPVARCLPLFAAYAAQVVHFGSLGAGQHVKLLNNLLFGANLELAIEAARLSEAFGIDRLPSHARSTPAVARAMHWTSSARWGLLRLSLQQRESSSTRTRW